FNLRSSIYYSRSTILNLQFSISNPLPTMPIHCLGFGLVTCDRILLLDDFPRPNQKLVIDNWTQQIGGPVAVGLMTMAAMGLRVHWGLPLGDDANSQRVMAQFQHLRIGFLNEAQQYPAHPTPEAIILVHRRSGARTVLLLNQPTPRLKQFKQIADKLPTAEWMYCDGREEGFVFALKDWAKRNQTKLFFDLGSQRPNWNEIIAGGDIVIVSDDFMRQLDPALTLEATLQQVIDCGVKIAGMTLGREGSLFLQAGKYWSIPAHPAPQVIDTTNAGDVFHGAFLAAWIKTNSIARSATFASRCAAWAVAHTGHQLHVFDEKIRREFGSLHAPLNSIT
ncbi:MAG: carbohydrate kinase family protein, partial [bacterium]